MFDIKVGPLMAQDDGGGSAAEGADKGQVTDQAPEETPEFLAWLKTQPANVQDMYEKQVQGLKSALKKERAAADQVPTLLKQVSTFKTQEEERKRAQMSAEELRETELVQSKARADALAQELAQTRLEREVERAATTLNFIDPTDVLRLIDAKLIQTAEDGSLTGVKEAVSKLAKDKAYLIKSQDAKEEGKPVGNVIKKKKEEKQEPVVVVPTRSKL